MKIGVIITTFGSIDPEVYHNHLSVLLNWKTRYDLEVYHISDTQQESSLNAMTEQAFKDGCDYMFFMEHDNLYDKEALPMLLRHDLDIVTGYYTFRNWPYAPIPLLRMDNGLLYRMEYIHKPDADESLKEITVGCFGCCLVKASVLKHLFDKKLQFRREYNKKEQSSLTVDCVFFADIIKEGFKAYVDGAVGCGHQGRKLTVTPDNYRLYREFVKTIHPELIPVSERLSDEELEDRINYLLGVKACST